MQHFVDWLEQHQSLAGWAQAVGALLTLWIAFAVPGLQRQAAQRDSEEALGPVVHAALDSLHFCLLFHDEDSERAKALADLKYTLQALGDFPTQGLRLKLIRPLMQFKTTCGYLQARFNGERETSLALIHELDGVVIDMYMKSALEHACNEKGRAQALFI